jgi:hypothetical protein
METRTLLLALHIAAAASWLGADVIVHALTPRFERDSPAVATAWVRAQVWMHDRYYATVAVVLLASGILLVLDGDWSWSSDFIWVGVGAVVLGAALGGGGLGSLSKRRLAALEAGDAETAEATSRKLRGLSVVVTLLPIVAILAMVDKWGL